MVKKIVFSDSGLAISGGVSDSDDAIKAFEEWQFRNPHCRIISVSDESNRVGHNTIWVWYDEPIYLDPISENWNRQNPKR